MSVYQQFSIEEVEMSISEKMFKIAEYLGDLNKNNKVKGWNQNNKGHATVHGIKKGCCIRVHHEMDSLTLDLLISTTASTGKNREICDATVKEFEGFAILFDLPLYHDPNFYVPSQPNVKYSRHWMDITKVNDKEIAKILQEIIKHYHAN